MDLVFLLELYKMYGIKESDKSMNLLYHYIYIKAGLKNDNKKVSEQQLMNFILEELNITVFSNNVIYDDVDYNIKEITRDFIESLEFRASFEGEISINNIQKEIYLTGYKKALINRKSKYYKTHIKYNRLLALNEYFNINPESNIIEGFKTDENYNPYKRTLEEQLRAVLDSEKILNNTTRYISEADLEDYVVNNLSIIEDGLVFIDRQVTVSGGIIDILAKDIDGKLAIIELKIDDDKSIVWQAMYYPKEISRIHRVDRANIRMLTIAPSYKKSILEALNNIDHVELYSYSIEVSLGEIQRLQIYLAN